MTRRLVSAALRALSATAFVLTVIVPTSAMAQQAPTTSTVTITVDSPADATAVSNGTATSIGGWAVDATGPGTGIDMVKVYLDGKMENNGTLVGTATYGDSRPDVGTALGDADFATSGYDYTWTPSGLSAGQHTLYIYAHSVANGWYQKTVSISVAGDSATTASTSSTSQTTTNMAPRTSGMGGGQGSAYGGGGGAPGMGAPGGGYYGGQNGMGTPGYNGSIPGGVNGLYGNANQYGAPVYGSAYGANGYGTPYGASSYGTPYGASSYGSPYGASPYGSAYGSQYPGAYGAPYGSDPYASAYGSPYASAYGYGSPYAGAYGSPYTSPYATSPYTTSPYAYSSYSPYGYQGYPYGYSPYTATAASSIPYAVTTTATSTTMTLSWTPSATAMLYRVYQSTTSGTGFTLVQTAAQGASTVTISGLTPGITYYFGVTAVDPSGVESPIAATANTGVATSGYTTTVVPTTSGVTLTWTPTSNAVLYRIYGSGYTTSALTLMLTAAPGSSSATLTGLTPGYTYTLQVRAVDVSGIETPIYSYSNNTTSTTLVAPTGLYILSSRPTTTNLVWTAASGAVSYRVLLSVNGGPFTAAVMTLNAATSAVVSGLLPGTTYSFEVIGLDAYGNQSAPSAPVIVTTPLS